MRLNGISKGECFNVTAYGPFAYPQRRNQVGYGLPAPLAEQRKKLLPPLTNTHSLTSSASSRILYMLMRTAPVRIKKFFEKESVKHLEQGIVYAPLRLMS